MPSIWLPSWMYRFLPLIYLIGGSVMFFAFGDETITPTRIAYALATYQRTLFPNQTPWDRFEAGEIDALTENQRRGWEVFLTTACTICHRPPGNPDKGRTLTIGADSLADHLGHGDTLGACGDD